MTDARALPPREERILNRLARLFAQRDGIAARMLVVDEKIRIATKELAAGRGTIFIRPDTVRQEIGTRAA